MNEKNGTLANGEILHHSRFDVEYCNNYYKKSKGKWFIFGNLSLYPVHDEDMIIKLENELMINKSKGE